MNELAPTTRHYKAYLLRFWRNDDFGRWHIFVKNVQTGEEHHFATIEQCIVFLANVDADYQNSNTNDYMETIK